MSVCCCLVLGLAPGVVELKAMNVYVGLLLCACLHSALSAAGELCKISRAQYIGSSSSLYRPFCW